MRALTKKVFGRTLGTIFIGCLASAPVIADQWKTAAELRAEKTQPAPVSQMNKQQSASTSQDFLKHRAPSSVTSGERLQLRAKIAGKDGVKLARVYFKTASAHKYNFVVLNKGERGIYSADIPAAGSSVSAVEYKIVVQNAFGEVYKTEKYSVPVKASTSNQVAQNDGFIDVFSEYPEKTAETTGFIDNVRYTYGATKLITSLGSSVSVASSGSGYVGGASSTASSAAGASTGATTATASTAATAVSTTSVVAVGAGTVAVAAVGDPSGTEGNDYGATKVYGGDSCYTGYLKETFNDPQFGLESITVGLENGQITTVSHFSDELGGCQSGSVTLNPDVTNVNDGQCFTVAMIDSIVRQFEGNGATYEYVNGHSCPPIVYIESSGTGIDQ